MFTEDDIIYAYTRKQAIADGLQVNLSEKFPNDCRLYKVPVFCTNRVWNLIESAIAHPQHHNDAGGVVWDICHMSINGPGRISIRGGTGTQFAVIVTGADATPDFHEEGLPIYQLHAVCGAVDIDDPRAAITFMFPNED